MSNTVTEKISDIYGAATEGISNIITAVSNKINNKDPGKGNKVPPGNRPVEPTGKGANMGPENIGDPGDFGGPGFKPPENPGPIPVTTAIIVTSALLLDENGNFISDVIDQFCKNSEKKGK